MCFAKFAVTYDVMYGKGASEDDASSGAVDKNISQTDDSTDDGNTIILQEELGKMRKRKKEGLLHVKCYSVSTTPRSFTTHLLDCSLNAVQSNPLIQGITSYLCHYVTKKRDCFNKNIRMLITLNTVINCFRIAYIQQN